MSSAARSVRTLGVGKQHKLFARYQDAHRAFSRGNFLEAINRYRSLSESLRPYFASIVRQNLGIDRVAAGRDAGDSDLSEAEIAQTLAGLAPETFDRLRYGTRESRTAALCSAVAHDLALICRHLAEGSERGRDEQVSSAIIAALAHAIAVNPQNPINYHNLAGYEDYLGRDAEAAGHYRLALQLYPAQWESWVSWGHACARLGDRESAETCWANAFNVTAALDEQNHQKNPGAVRERRWAMAMLRLLKGDYAHGWDDYEGRLTFPPYVDKHGRPDVTAPRWDGREITGARTPTLYLHQEQGAGDAIMTARYISLAQDRVGVHGRVIIEVISAMVPLFAAMFPELEIVAKGETPPEHDAQLPMFSLPHVFGTTLENVPPVVPFQVVSGENVPIVAEPGRIGLCWRGSTTHPNDLVRSTSFESCFPLLDATKDLPGVAWQSLQFGYETGAPLDPLPPGDFLETARQIARCSLVITVDTSVAHLAGVMGVPTWLLLPFVAEWRWLQDRDDSPWYPSMRLWRQAKAGDWKELTARVAAALAEQLQQSSSTSP